MDQTSKLTELYEAFGGDWQKFFGSAATFWKERRQATAPTFQQPQMLGCPWCGVVPEVRRLPLISPDTFDVTCRNPSCPRRIISATSPEECARRWNTRV